MDPSRTLGIKSEAVLGSVQFQLRMPESISHVLGSQCSTAVRTNQNRAPWGEGIHDPVSHVTRNTS
eukprot:5011833-Alexandrium_andersonii.AAC.1